MRGGCPGLRNASPQLACGQDGQLKGFAVLEYETAEMAEAAQQQADGLALGGSHLRVSFCAPGPPGRSMLAALIAAQATVSVCGTGHSSGWGWARSVPTAGPCSAALSLLRPSTVARGSCPSPASCSYSAAWARPPPFSCCSTRCSTAARGASRVSRASRCTPWRPRGLLRGAACPFQPRLGLLRHLSEGCVERWGEGCPAGDHCPLSASPQASWARPLPCHCSADRPCPQHCCSSPCRPRATR